MLSEFIAPQRVSAARDAWRDVDTGTQNGEAGRATLSSDTVALRSLSLRELRRADPASDRIFFHNIWFRGHNNGRYAQLLPRLTRLDPYLVVCSDRRVVRGVQFRALRRTRWVRNRMVFALAARHYGATFTTDIEQIPFIRGPVVVDIDDPNFTEAEVDLLSHPNVRAYVVTTEQAAREYERIGLSTPWHVVPQGVDLGAFEPSAIREVAAAQRRPGELVVGYVAAWLLTHRDKAGDNALYNIDHLLDIWDGVHDEMPTARLWLVGEPSANVVRRCARRDDVLLLGRLAQRDVLAHTANFDIALYPRRDSPARFRSAMKIAEYLGAGVPTVAYELDETLVLRATGSGLLVRDAGAFAAALRHLARDDAARGAIAEHARRAGLQRDWRQLAHRYETDILDTHLCRPRRERR